MTSTHVIFGDKARTRLLRGVDVLANAVASTLGPRGRTVLIRKGYGGPKISNDGVTVAKSIELADPDEQTGAEVVRQAAEKTGDLAGDGTTTATVLAQSIIHEGVKAVAAGMNPMDVKRGIEAAVAAVVADLAAHAREITGRDEIAQIGTISANGDTTIGALVADAMEKVGPEGAITIEEAKGLETELDVVEGLQFDRGYLSPYFATDGETLRCDLEDPHILIFEKKLADLQAMLPLLDAVMQAGKPLLIIAEDVDAPVLATLVVNKLRGGLKVCAVKAPGFGDRRKAMLQDIAVVTGGTFVSEDLGLKLENVGLELLGRAQRVLVTKDDATIVGGAGKTTDIEARCAQIRSQIAETNSDYDRDKLKERLAKLSGGVAVIRAGGATEIEVKERKDRIDDAVNATRAAVEEGIVPGGGVALLYAGRALDGVHAANGDQRVGVEILRRAVRAPVRVIAENAGGDGALVVSRLIERNDRDYGYDAQTGEYRDMVAAGIIDPAKVMRLALQNGASVASLLITTNVVVVEQPEPRSETGRLRDEMAL